MGMWMEELRLGGMRHLELEKQTRNRLRCCCKACLVSEVFIFLTRRLCRLACGLFLVQNRCSGELQLHLKFATRLSQSQTPAYVSTESRLLDTSIWVSHRLPKTQYA